MDARRAPPERGQVDLNRWPLVGRDDEVALATSALSAGGSVVLTGAAGIGKTRLAREVIARGAQEPDRTEWVAATHAAAAVPLGAVAHLVPSESIGRGRDATLRSIVGALHRGEGDERLLLGVDDAHLLDDASAALVHQLVTNGTASAVVTLRSGESPPDSIVALWKDGPATLIELQALARTEVETVAMTVLGGAVEGATLQLLWEASAGNALYLHELVRHGIESGALLCEQGLWRWPGRLDPGERLQDLVAMRMGALAEEERASLELVAVGEPVTAGCLVHLGVTEPVERLERRGLVVMRRGGASAASVNETWLAHPLFGEVLRRAMPSTRLDQVRRLLADALEDCSDGSDGTQFRVTLWRLDAGDRSRPEELRIAAARALRLWDHAIAERLARAALESGPDMETAYVLGGSFSRQGRSQEALAAFETAHDLPGSDELRGDIASAEAGVLFYQLGREADARTVLQDAIRRVEDVEVQHRLGATVALLGGNDPFAPREVNDIANASPEGVLYAALEHMGAGRLGLAVSMVDEVMTTRSARVAERPVVALQLQMARTWATLLRGDVLEAETTADREYSATVRSRADYPRVGWCLMRGSVAVLRGLPRQAVSALREGSVLLGSDDRGYARPMSAYLAMACALAGDVDAAEDCRRRAIDSSSILDGIFGVDVARAGAWVLAARGEVTAAAEEISSAADLAASRNQPTFEAFALHDLARFGRAADTVDRLDELAGVVDSVLIDAFAAHARALATHDGTALDAVAVKFADLALDLFAAEALMSAAAVHRRAGRKASAFASRDRAHVFTEGCEHPRTPALARVDAADDLTGREREVCELAADELASREIAERLGITTRTVDNLLGRVYAKLGVSGRLELTELLGKRAGR